MLSNANVISTHNNTETKNAVRQAIGEDIVAVASDVRKTTPHLSGSDIVEAADDDSEQTTASIASERIDNDDGQTADGDTTATTNGLVAVENGRMKRFMRDMRSKGRGMSCRHADAVAVEDEGTFIWNLLLCTI